MEFLVATILFPALLVVLATAAGLLVDRALGGALPGALVPVTGLAALIVLAELCTATEATAPLAPFAFVVLAVAGLILGWPRLRRLRPNWWLAGASLAVYLVACAPVLLNGHVTLAGYLLDTTVAFHLAGSEYLLEHARNFARLPESSFRGTMESYFGARYPGGGQALLGGGSRLVGTPSIWLYQPLISLLLAFCVAPLYQLARAGGLARPPAAVAAGLAAMPGLVYSYAQMGAIKELTVLPFVLLLGALLVVMPRLLALGLRGGLALAVAGAAGVGAIGLAFMPWLLGVVAVGLALLLRPEGTRRAEGSGRGRVRARQDWRALAKWVAALAAMLVVLAIPTFGPIGDSLTLARGLSASNEALAADPGNLARPLLPSQMAGVWLGGSHRFDPPNLGLTFSLIGLMIAAAAFGALALLRRREWGVPAFAAVLAVVLVALTARGTMWTDAKLLVISSPMVVLLAAIGVDSLRRIGRRVEAVVLGAALALAVLASNAYTYHDTNLAPTDRYRELLSIGERYADEGPTLLPEFDEFGLYALADMAPAGPGFAAKPAGLATLSDGSLTAYGHSYDVDQMRIEVVDGYSTIVMRRRPDASRPPASFELAERGKYYDVWRRTDGPRVLAHLGAGGGLQPAGELDCGDLERLARRADARGASIRYAIRPRMRAINPRFVSHRPAGWGIALDGVGLSTPGEMRQRFSVPVGGEYLVWLKGDFARAVKAAIDGRPLGEAAYETGNEGNFATPFRVSLRPGRHVLMLERGGGSLHPGDGGPSRLMAILFEPAAEGPPTAEELPAGQWRSLCGRQVDWVELVRST